MNIYVKHINSDESKNFTKYYYCTICRPHQIFKTHHRQQHLYFNHALDFRQNQRIIGFNNWSPRKYPTVSNTNCVLYDVITVGMYNTHDRLAACLSSSIERHELLNMDAFSWTGLERSIIWVFFGRGHVSGHTNTKRTRVFKVFTIRRIVFYYIGIASTKKTNCISVVDIT